YREALQSCYENSDKILNFLQVLTDITEAENRSKKLKLEKRYISDLVREIMSLYEMAFEEKEIQLTQNLDSNDWAMVDARLISRVIANLLDNAHKYTPSGGAVVISTVNQTENVILRVTDTGPGISPEEHAMIWQKLYRSDKSRSEYGMGLGLTFVKAVVEAHDGKVSVRSPVKDGRGTEFEVLLQKMS
ncbi:MAG: HAMP domain-containing sensor histidine kinase, partial [Bdellovibrio sp.]